MEQHPGDYKHRLYLHIIERRPNEIFRVETEITREEANKLSALFDQFPPEERKDSNAIEIGTPRIWMTGSSEYVGPPERSPELKYQKK